MVEVKKQIPIGVKVISALYFIGTIIPLGRLLRGIFPTKFVLWFVIAVVIPIVIGIGLWRGQKWTRMIAILFAISGTIISVLAITIPHYTSVYITVGVFYQLISYVLPMGTLLMESYYESNWGVIIIGLAINLAIAIYLTFNKNVKSAFK